MIPLKPIEVSGNLCRMLLIVFHLKRIETKKTYPLAFVLHLPLVKSCFVGVNTSAHSGLQECGSQSMQKFRGKKQVGGMFTPVWSGLLQQWLWMNCLFHLSCHIYRYKVVNDALLEFFKKTYMPLPAWLILAASFLWFFFFWSNLLEIITLFK